MKDLLLLPFYLTAFFSNSLQITTPEVKEKITEREKIEIKLDLKEFIDSHFSVKEQPNRKSFDQKAFKLELLQQSRKK